MTAYPFKKRVAVLISGRGSNLGALIAAQKDAPYEIVLVISNFEGAAGLQRARNAGIASLVIPHKGKPRELFDGEIDAALRKAEVEIVCLAGFMRILSETFTRAWEGMLLNIHPSLLPEYKGTHVHERVIEAKETQSGATVHFVLPELDDGPIIAQGQVAVHPDDTPETLAARVLTVEHKIYPQAVKLVAEGRVKLRGGLAVFI